MKGVLGATFWNHGWFAPKSWLHCNLALTCSDPLSVHGKKSLRKKYQWLSIIKGKSPYQEKTDSQELSM